MTDIDPLLTARATPPRRPRRPHPARGSRIAAAGLGVSTMFGLVAAMGLAAAAGTSTAASDATVTPVPPTQTLATVSTATTPAGHASPPTAPPTDPPTSPPTAPPVALSARPEVRVVTPAPTATQQQAPAPQATTRGSR